MNEIDSTQGSTMFVALETNPDRAFDPVLHRRNDLMPMSVAYVHGEFKQRVLRVSYVNGADVPDVRSFTRAIVWTVRADGSPWILGDGEIQPPNYALVDTGTVLEILCRKRDYLVRQRAIMSQVMQNPFLYVPEISRASDVDDVNTILEASTSQLEWTRDGIPFLASILGDPTKLKVMTRDVVSIEDGDVSDNGAPPNAIVGTLAFDFTERRVSEQSVGPMITTRLSDTAKRFQEAIIADGTDSIARIQDASTLCTFNPGALSGGWPVERSMINGFFVRRSQLSIPPKGQMADGAIADALQPSTDTRSKPLATKDPGDPAGVFGRPVDPYEDAYSDPTGRSWTTIRSTPFLPVLLDVIGIQSRQRREIVRMILPYGGQDFRVGNAEPTHLSFVASGISDDETTREYESDREYMIGDQVQVSGVNAICRIPFYSDAGSFWESFIEDDPENPAFGEDRWTFVEDNRSSLGRSDADTAADTLFGKRCIQWMANRLVTTMAFATRTISITVTVPLEEAADLDPSWTVRILHPRMKTGQAEGKVVNVEATWDYDEPGNSLARVTIACCIGAGDGIDPLPGDGEGEEGAEGDGEGEAVTGTGVGMTVRYRIEPYIPQAIGQAGVLKVVDRFFGWEQEWLIMNPANELYGKSYVEGANVSDFLEKEVPSSLALDFSPATTETGPIQQVQVTMGAWRGPRQVEL